MSTEVSEACRASSTPFVIDDTLASVLNVDLLAYADMIVTSLSKWASGYSDVMAGLVTVNPNSPMYAELQAWFCDDCHQESGGQLYVADAEVLAKNIEGFESRVHQVNQNAQRVAEYCAQQSEIDQVYYPLLNSKLAPKNEELYDQVIRSEKSQIGEVQPGASGVLSLKFKSQKDAGTFFDHLKVSKGPSLGTEFSLACLYTLLAHYDEMEFAKSCHIDPYLLRLSVGIEPAEELIERLHRAFEAIR